MADDTFLLTVFTGSWKDYQDHLTATLAPLTAAQLALRAAPGLRSISENALHLVGCRMFWFTDFLGEDGGAQLQPYAQWNEAALAAPYASEDELARALGGSAPSGSALAAGLDHTWQLMTDCLERWGTAGLRQTFPDVGEDGTRIEIPRAWVVWHVLEHDLHHGGELSLTLGMHGIPAEFAV